MKSKVLVVVVMTLCAAAAFAQENAQSQQQPNEDAMMKAMIAAGTPGEAHKALDDMAGTWNVAISAWGAPGTEPMRSTGTAESVWLMDGRYLEQRFKGEFAGMPFEGRGYAGYDNLKKQYWSTWMDNMSTAMMITTGSRSGNTWTFRGTMADPMTGSDYPIEERITVTDRDHHTMEMWGPGPDGRSFKMMEIKYTRK